MSNATPLRELPAKWDEIAAGAPRGAAKRLRTCAAELRAALSARDEAGAVPLCRNCGQHHHAGMECDGPVYDATPPASGEAAPNMQKCAGCGSEWPDYLFKDGKCIKCRKTTPPAASGEAGADDLLEIYPGDYVPVQVPAGWRPTTLRYETVGDAMRVSMSESDFNELRRLAAVAPASDHIDAMVNRFLGWRLPDDFAPDNGISYAPIPRHPDWTHDTHPTGTNLFHAGQARAMFAHCVAAVAPAGMVLVPRKLTSAMIRAFGDAPSHFDEREELQLAWDAMLAAAPTPPATAGQE